MTEEEEEEEDDEGEGRDKGMALGCGGEQQVGGDDPVSAVFLTFLLLTPKAWFLRFIDK